MRNLKTGDTDRITDAIIELTEAVNNLASQMSDRTLDQPTGNGAEDEDMRDDDPYPLITVLEEWDGLHEDNDREKLMALFAKQGIDFDPSELPWCGVGLRAALKKAGYPDPGPKAAKAIFYLNYGTESLAPKRGDIWISETHVAVVYDVREDDGVIILIGCNQSQKVCILPAQNRNGTKNFGDRVALRTPPEIVSNA